jgi:hypothetical protein
LYLEAAAALTTMLSVGGALATWAD